MYQPPEAIFKGYIEVGGEQIGYRLKNDRLEKLSDNGFAKQRRMIGMVSQQFNLCPHMTVLQNIIEAPEKG
ncbi:ABC-type histidine transport system ATPase subunit [Rhizobium flavum]|uniref:ABC-type histidine transport system ATPase subunit n=1 Tax=Pseudorhizobium flavum TaxID=1335061 RepID=A0A7X0DEK2_9HYPH|nr:ABC-type histidine transport system ATPase subunit [Pseudorhizobium flavum]CAD6606500.1 amino acid ABC transporter ATP-binding protein [Pseudorhizobium flavum]